MTAPVHDVLIAVGSNIEPQAWIPRGLALLAEQVEIVATSPAYRCAAVGGSGPQPPFTNLALRVRTALDAAALKAVCREIEARCGRVRTEDRYAPRTLDLDVVSLEEAALAEAFVLVPAADVWPEALAPRAAGLGDEPRAALHRLPEGTYA